MVGGGTLAAQALDRRGGTPLRDLKAQDALA
jgi:hypothetical protein